MRSPRGILQPPGLRLAHDVSPLLLPGSAGVGQPNPQSCAGAPRCGTAQEAANPRARCPQRPIPCPKEGGGGRGDRLLTGRSHRCQPGRRNSTDPPGREKEGGSNRTLCALLGRGAEGTLPQPPGSRAGSGPGRALPRAPEPFPQRWAPRCAADTGKGAGGLAASSSLPAPGPRTGPGPGATLPWRPIVSEGPPPATVPALPPRDSPQGPLQPNRAPLPPPPPPQRTRRRHFVYLPPPPGPAALPPLPPPPGLAPPWRPTSALIGRRAGPAPASSPAGWLRSCHEEAGPARWLSLPVGSRSFQPALSIEWGVTRRDRLKELSVTAVGRKGQRAKGEGEVVAMETGGGGSGAAHWAWACSAAPAVVPGGACCTARPSALHKRSAVTPRLSSKLFC